ncbi:MAG: glycosyltransferase [Candidatus Acidiferrum sp.]
MSPPLVSVLMSVFNGEKYLAVAIDSILGQTFSDFEFIVIDDGSTDSTARILSDYAVRDSRLRVVQQQNKGRTASLNIGLGLCKGTYIARMDADDFALASRFGDQVSFMERNQDVVLVGGAIELMGSRGQTLRAVIPPLDDSEIRASLLRQNPICHPAVLLRKEVVLAVGGYRGAFQESEDYDLWLRMSERGRLANLGQVVLKYRVHGGQVSVRYLRCQAECLLAAQGSAACRSQGALDPLAGADKLGPETLRDLGVKEMGVQQFFVDAYYYWAQLLRDSDPEAFLQIGGQVLRMCRREYVGRAFLADAWLTVAAINFERGERLKALTSAAQAFAMRPIIAGRPVKRAFTWLVATLKA